MDWLWSILSGISLAAVVLVAQWVIRIVLIPIVLERHRPAVATTWLIVVFFEPFIGLVIYLVIGRQLVGRKRIDHHRRVAEEIDAGARRDRTGRSSWRWMIFRNTDGTRRLAKSLSGMPAVTGNAVDLIHDTDEVIDRLIADIDAATHHVHLLFYIFAADTTGLRVADAAGAGERARVACRVMMDSQGSPAARSAPQSRRKV